MGWVDSPKFFCAFSETLTDVANALVNSDLPVPSYVAISEIPSTGPGPPHTPESLTHIDCYMDEVISLVQGGPDCQHQVFDGTVRALKWLFPSLLGELKDSVSVKKLVAEEGDWICVKEVLGWILDTDAGTASLATSFFTLTESLSSPGKDGKSRLRAQTVPSKTWCWQSGTPCTTEMTSSI